jgi:hypothetical protein
MLKDKIRKIALVSISATISCLLPAIIFINSELKLTAAEKPIETTMHIECNINNIVNDDGQQVIFVGENEKQIIINAVGRMYYKSSGLQTNPIYKQYLSIIEKPGIELGYGKIVSENVTLRKAPSIRYKPTAFLQQGAIIYVMSANNGWYEVVSGNQIGYIQSNDVKLIDKNDIESQHMQLLLKRGQTIVTRVEPTFVDDYKEEKEAEFGAKIVSTAKQYLGIPYKSGGTNTNGFDCSGFVYYVYNKAGYPLSRMMSEQYKAGTPVKKSELKPGDILFFQNTHVNGMSHVGIYTGNGQFIHSPRTGKTVSYADLNSEYWVEHYYGAVRINKK